MKQLTKAQIKQKHNMLMLRLIGLVAEQVKLYNSYEEWKQAATIDAKSTVKRIGCYNCFKNIKEKIIAITQENKKAVKSTYYIEPDCLDYYWNMYKFMDMQKN